MNGLCRDNDIPSYLRRIGRITLLLRCGYSHVVELPEAEYAEMKAPDSKRIKGARPIHSMAFKPPDPFPCAQPIERAIPAHQRARRSTAFHAVLCRSQTPLR